MVRLRIERHKRYPRLAKIRQIEGRAKVRFVIDPHGKVQDVMIVKGSRHQRLDEAALNAIRMASPFPRPPRHLFSGPISLEITIVFELT
jgi:protein TonB